MAINLDIVGKRTDPAPHTYKKDDVMLYALGIGAGVKELDFVYEKNLKVFPTYAVIPILPAFIPLILESKLNMTAVLHGEQKIVLHRPIPPAGTIHSTGVMASVYDKAERGAIVNFAFESKDENGEILFENEVALVDRSAGNFGGDRGPKAEKLAPPGGKEPDFRVAYTTSPDQAALYRLCGDKNPLHIDPDFAAKAGLDRPILHGLCSFGFAGRAILYSVCGGEPARFKSFSTRFMGVVYPGDTLTTEGWQVAPGKYIVQTKTQDGRVVLGNAAAEVA
jgi:acyl dehydratase